MIEALRRPGVRLAILGVAAYLLFLAANLPAAWLGYVLERSSGGALALGDPSGTVWKGQGTLAVRSGGAFHGVADIGWRCNPLSLLGGRLSLALSGSGPGASLRATLSLGVGGVRIQNFEASAPAALLESAVPAVALVKPDGRVRVRGDSFEVGPARVLGTATVEWSDAGMSGVARIGDYRLQITGTGERASVRLATLRGDLRLRGEGEWRAGQPQVVLRGEVEATPGRKDLEPLLQLLAGDGPGFSRPFGWTVTI
jgi:general secretion pathway protein N